MSPSLQRHGTRPALLSSCRSAGESASAIYFVTFTSVPMTWFMQAVSSTGMPGI
jgi:hypothetical protein